jgi:glycosyltransferase involved in cell wall biosynthesis
MPEIVLLCEYATLNGGERSMLATLDGIQAADFTPIVMAPSQGPLIDALVARQVKTMPFDCRDAQGVRIPQDRLRKTLEEMLQQRRPALLHANSLAMGRLSGPVAAKMGIPSLSHLRDILRLSSQAVADLNCHTRLIAVSEAVRSFHIAGGLHAEKVHVVYNGVDLEAFRPRPATGYLHQELGLPSDALLIGSIGQIGLRKGQDVLLQIAAQIVAQWPNVHFVIVGQRHSQKDESRQYEQALHGVADSHVHFLGVRTDVERLLNEWTLLVHTARQEPLGRVLLEASAAGTPVIATQVGGTAEIFPPELEAAKLIPPDNPEALATGIAELLGDATLRQRMAEAARLHAENCFAISTSVPSLLKHYRELLQNWRGG